MNRLIEKAQNISIRADIVEIVARCLDFGLDPF